MLNLKKVFKLEIPKKRMRREVSVSVFAVLIIAAAILTVYYLNIGPTGFAVFNQNSQISFDEGIYSNVAYDGSAGAVILGTNQTSGTYTSRVLDANSSSATWNNLTWQGSGVTFEVRNCTAADCSDANFTTVSNLDNLNLTGRYFQYKTSFDSVNDTLGGVTVDYTVTQQQQATPVSVSISEPAGEKTSLSTIPLTFTITGGTGTNLTCLYNINYAGGVLIANTSINCASGANTKTFSLANKGGDNTLTIYISDSSGSISASSGFSVSIPAGTITGGTVEEEETTTANETTTPIITQISLGEVPGQDIIQGDTKALSLSVQNTGTVPVSSCALSGDDSGLVTVTDVAKNINPGEGATFTFSVDISEGTTPGAYTLGLSVDCAETTASKQVTVNVLQKKLDFNITNVQRTREDRVRVDYSLTELSGEDQDVQVFFTIVDASGLQVANNSQNSSVDANKTDDFRVNIPINETLEGNLTLSASFNSQIYSSSVLEPITLGAPIGGFAIFGGIGGTGGVVILIVVVLVLVVVFFLARQMRKSGKTLGDLFAKDK